MDAFTAIDRLEYKMKQQWTELSKIKDASRYQQAKIEALKTYQALKKQKQLLGMS